MSGDVSSSHEFETGSTEDIPSAAGLMFVESIKAHSNDMVGGLRHLTEKIDSFKYLSSLGVVARLRLCPGPGPALPVSKKQFQILEITLCVTPVASATSASV
ncbi:hypothetical protein NPIL_296911 [Nephila pilipes]|uniref:Uncharacterized protein n=1 Tax=Nephila pilipes TaxID=299642 RepID=A0A8X6THN4_NEPPI|nr:hypothetical protein NPIL_296911 [Nephila pilipes]